VRVRSQNEIGASEWVEAPTTVQVVPQKRKVDPYKQTHIQAVGFDQNVKEAREERVGVITSMFFQTLLGGKAKNRARKEGVVARLRAMNRLMRTEQQSVQVQMHYDIQEHVHGRDGEEVHCADPECPCQTSHGYVSVPSIVENKEDGPSQILRGDVVARRLILTISSDQPNVVPYGCEGVYFGGHVPALRYPKTMDDRVQTYVAIMEDVCMPLEIVEVRHEEGDSKTLHIVADWFTYADDEMPISQGPEMLLAGFVFFVLFDDLDSPEQKRVMCPIRALLCVQVVEPGKRELRLQQLEHFPRELPEGSYKLIMGGKSRLAEAMKEMRSSSKHISLPSAHSILAATVSD